MRQPEPIRVSGRRIRSVRITRAGWAFIVLTLGIGLGALNSGNNLLYLVFGMLLSMLILNGILSRASLHNLTIRYRLPQRLYAGGNNPVHLQLHNHKRSLPSYALTLATQRKKGQARGPNYFIFKIEPGTAHDVVHQQPYAYRGRRALPRFQLRSSYPFGLIEKIIPVDPAAERVVYPEVKELAHAGIRALVDRGDYLSGHRGRGANPYGIRPFQDGDELRHVHWPSVAKAGEWMTKEFEQEKRTRVTLNLLVDEAPADRHGEARERAISALASLLVHCVGEEREVGLMINSRRIEPHGGGFLDFYLNVLSLFDDGEGVAGVAAGRSPMGDDGTIVAFSEWPAQRLDPAAFDVLAMADGESRP